MKVRLRPDPQTHDVTCLGRLCGHRGTEPIESISGGACVDILAGVLMSSVRIRVSMDLQVTSRLVSV